MAALRHGALQSYTYERHEVSLLHDGGELFAALGAGRDLVTQQVAGRQVREAVLLDDLVTLRALPATRTTYTHSQPAITAGTLLYIHAS